MTVKDLKLQLLEAYTLRNLNVISLTLLNLYKNKQISKLRMIAELIADHLIIEIKDDGKGFSALIKLYHPDRLNFYINEINRLAEEGDLDGLLNHSHILKLERIEDIAASLNTFEDIDYSPVYEWDINADGFNYFKDYDTTQREKVQDVSKKRSVDFYEAVKLRQYGSTDVEFPSYYLEDIDEFELSDSHIDDLDGVQYCLHARTMDLSDNQIADIRPLTGLAHLEVLDLSNNLINSIDALVNLHHLRKVHLANNKFDDITALMKIERLEYADLTGNTINPDQVNELRDSGIIVEF